MIGFKILVTNKRSLLLNNPHVDYFSFFTGFYMKMGGYPPITFLFFKINHS